MKYLVSLALVMSLVSVGFNWYVLSMQAQQKATNEATQLTICGEVDCAIKWAERIRAKEKAKK